MKVEDYIIENEKRYSELFSKYDPITGLNSPLERFEYRMFKDQANPIFLPEAMKELIIIDESLDYESLEEYSIAKKRNFDQDTELLNKLRMHYDFEFWAVVTVKIKPKATKTEEGTELVPFKINRPQRKLLKVLEKLRVANEPIWVIILKARQWGGTTLVEIYMGWIQLIHKRMWNSLIVGSVEKQAKVARAMYQTLIDKYPKQVQDISLRTFEQTKDKIIPERGCVINIASMEKPENIRAQDLNGTHWTEVGSWKQTLGKRPEDLEQSVLGTLEKIPYSYWGIESTAKGTGNYFHRKWLSAVAGNNNMTPVFIAWYEIEKNVIRFKSELEKIEFIKSLNEYEMFLWDSGATLEGINWYRLTLKDYEGDHWRMKAEAPTNAQEAFQATGRRAFQPSYTKWMDDTVKPPVFIGDTFPNMLSGPDALHDIKFESTPNGNLKIWKKPNDPPVPKGFKMKNRYIVAVDVGGRTEQADYSVITVIDRFWMEQGDVPVIVSTWRGHLDQDLFAWKAAQVAKYYENALLVFESNTYDQDNDTEGNHLDTLLNEVATHYTNMYTRTRPELIAEGAPRVWGFQTNKTTKPMIVNKYNGLLRDKGFLEFDQEAVNEANFYEIKDKGRYGNVDGQHDDILMTRMIGLWVATDPKNMDIPILVELPKKKTFKQRDSNRSNTTTEKSVANF